MNLDLDQLERLLSEATPGPWDHDERTLESSLGGIGTIIYAGSYNQDIANTKLIVALRNAAPALIARVREQEEILEQAKGVFIEIDDVTDELDKANARIKELENPQIATVIDPDTGFTINGPEWLQLPLKARLIIQELSLKNDALKAQLADQIQSERDFLNYTLL